jgi:hypothetical protein
MQSNCRGWGGISCLRYCVRLSCFQVISTHAHGIFKWQHLLPSLQGPAAGPYDHARAFNSEDFSYSSWVTLRVRVLGSFISQFFEMQVKILAQLAFLLEVLLMIISL